MAAVSEVITLGVGTPSAIKYLVTTGLGMGAAPPSSAVKTLAALGCG